MTLADSISIERQIDAPRVDELGIKRWPTWSHEAATFPWTYDESETAYVLEGEVVVHLNDGSSVQFGAGDLVTFPSGLCCTWEIRKRINKHYRFG